MNQMTIDSSLHMPGVFTRRVGRPRTGYVREKAKWYFEKEKLGEEYDHDNEEHCPWVKNKAIAGKF